MRVYCWYSGKTSRWCGQSGMSVCPCSRVSQTVTTLSVALLNVACPKWKVDPICNVAALRFDWFRNYGDSWCQRLELPERSTLVFGWNRYSGESDIVFIHVLCSFCLLFGCETWYVTLRQERRLRVFENRMLRNIFGPKRGEVTGEWRRLRNEELNDLYCSPNIFMYVSSILLSLLFTPTNAQRIY
jgi:hypothetical protein